MLYIGLAIVSVLVGFGIFSVLADKQDEVDASYYECIIHHSR